VLPVSAKKALHLFFKIQYFQTTDEAELFAQRGFQILPETDFLTIMDLRRIKDLMLVLQNEQSEINSALLSPILYESYTKQELLGLIEQSQREIAMSQTLLQADAIVSD